MGDHQRASLHFSGDSMSTSAQVAIIGAGPYGLSIAAHLRARGVAFRIFGLPMHSWRAQMPKGMWLKSEGFASNLYDPESSFTLRHFCEQRGHAYSELGLPIRLDILTAYGLSFQERFVFDLETKKVASLERSSVGFALRLEDGEMVFARSEEHTSELQSLAYLVCRLLLEKKKKLSHHILVRKKTKKNTIPRH